MTKAFTIHIPDELDQALSLQAQRLKKSPEEVILELLLQQLSPRPAQPANQETQPDEEPLLKFIGSIHLDNIHDLGENHDYYIGQALYQDLNPNE